MLEQKIPLSTSKYIYYLLNTQLFNKNLQSIINTYTCHQTTTKCICPIFTIDNSKKKQESSQWRIKQWLASTCRIKYREFFLEFIRNSKFNLYNKFLTFQFKMSKRNWRKFSEKVRKVSGEQEKKYKQKQEKRWQCRICHSSNEDTQAFCIQCYLGLHYYAYVNMHMFVARDNSFETIYYPSKQLDSQSDSMSQHSSESECEVREESQDIKIDWIDNLLQDQ